MKKHKFLKRMAIAAVLAALVISVLSGCGGRSSLETAADEQLAQDAFISAVFLAETKVIVEEAVILAGEPANSGLMPVASGKLVKASNKAEIDYSNTADGYVMVKYTESTSKAIKVQVKGPSGTTYTYNLAADGAYDVLPLSDGNGSYKVTVYRNVSGTSYSTVTSVTFDVTLKDEFAPFIRPNQYVDYNEKTLAVAKAAELTKDKDALDKVKAVYTYVVEGYTYDYDKAASVTSGYLPDLDSVYKSKKGICFDYAALMTAMLRSQGVPTKLVVGYSGTVYHAWIHVYSETAGWINSVIYFDGSSWKLMDPTFASNAKQSSEIMKYIGNSKNYEAKYIY